VPRRLACHVLLVAALLSAPATRLPAQAPTLKVHVSVDMEGLAGVVTGEQLGPEGFEYARFRDFMTREALAAVTAARDAGATGIVVADSHGNGQNLLIEQFPPDVRIVRSWPRPLGMMEGIDASFDAAIFIGYHASTSNTAGVRAHTFSSATLTRVAINGTDVTEGAWNAAIAGDLGVPVVMMSGDDAAIAEVKRLVGDMETVETKKALSFHSAMTLTPQAAAEAIGRAVRTALERRASFRPYVVRKPVTVDVGFKHYTQVEVLSSLPIFERTSSHSIRFTAKDMREASRFMRFIGEYRSDLTP